MNSKSKGRMPEGALSLTTTKSKIDKNLKQKIIIAILVAILAFCFTTQSASYNNMPVMPVAQAALNPNVIKAPLTANREREVLCLAKNMFYEARGTSLDEKLRVANVTINRAKSSLYPKTICDVVMQPKQFSWTLEKKKLYNSPTVLYKHKAIELEAWNLSMRLANKIVYQGMPRLLPINILHYATHDAKKTWQPKMIVAFKSKWHTFYRGY